MKAFLILTTILSAFFNAFMVVGLVLIRLVLHGATDGLPIRTLVDTTISAISQVDATRLRRF